MKCKHKVRTVVSKFEFLGLEYNRRYYKCTKCNEHVRQGKYKICANCLETKPRSKFKKHSYTLDGLWWYCNKCKDKAIKSKRQ